MLTAVTVWLVIGTFYCIASRDVILGDESGEMFLGLREKVGNSVARIVFALGLAVVIIGWPYWIYDSYRSKGKQDEQDEQ